LISITEEDVQLFTSNGPAEEKPLAAVPLPDLTIQKLQVLLALLSVIFVGYESRCCNNR
jgi:hypothetical protein